MDSDVVIAVTMAVAAGFSFALSDVWQQAEAELVSMDHTLRPSLLVRLARRPRWLLGMAADLGGFGFHAAALAFGSLIFVQPILACGLLFSLFLARVMRGQRVHRREGIAAVVLAAGLSVFLIDVSPTGGIDRAPPLRWILAGPIVAGAIIVCIVVGLRAVGPTRALMFGLAGGITFGMTAALTKAFVSYFDDGFGEIFTHWESYALAVLAPTGQLLMQSSFQAGSLRASVAAMEVSEPLVAIALGFGIFDERLEGRDWWHIAIAAAAGVAIVYGLIVLSGATREDRLPSSDANVRTPRRA